MPDDTFDEMDGFRMMTRLESFIARNRDKVIAMGVAGAVLLGAAGQVMADDNGYDDSMASVTEAAANAEKAPAQPAQSWSIAIVQTSPDDTIAAGKKAISGAGDIATLKAEATGKRAKLDAATHNLDTLMKTIDGAKNASTQDANDQIGNAVNAYNDSVDEAGLDQGLSVDDKRAISDWNSAPDSGDLLAKLHQGY